MRRDANDFRDAGKPTCDPGATVAGVSLVRPAVAFAWAVGLVTVLFGLVFAVATPTYETNDDSAMMALASGIMTGEPTEYIVCSNILIGRMLKTLYLSWPGVNWYTAYLYSVHFAAMTALLFALLVRHASRVTLFLFLLLFLVLEVRFLLLVQFTSTSVVATSSGIALLLLVTCDSRGFTKVATLLAGVALMAVGAMVRTNAFYLCCGLSVPYLVYEWRAARSLRPLFPVAGGIALGLALIAYSHSVYAGSPAWTHFLEFNKARIRVHNYRALEGFVEDDGNVRFVLDRLGWSANDVQLLRLWCYADAELYSPERLTQAVNVFGKVAPKSLKAFEYVDHPFQLIELDVIFALLMAVVLLILLRQGGTAYASVAVQSLVLFAAAFVYLAIYASAPVRVTLSALYAAVACYFYAWLAIGSRCGGIRSPGELTLPGRSVLERGRAIVLLGVVLALARDVYLVSGRYADRNWGNAQDHAAYEYFVDRLARDYAADTPQSGFVTLAGGFPVHWPSATSDCSRMSDILLIRFGWTLLSPHYRAMLARHSLDNVFRGLRERPNLYLLCVDGMQRFVTTYFQEHLNESVAIVDDRFYWFEDEKTGVPRSLAVRKVIDPGPTDSASAGDAAKELDDGRPHRPRRTAASKAG